MFKLSRLKILKECWFFVKEDKKWWLAPLILIIAISGLLFMFIQASPIAPLIYTIF